MFRRLIQIIFFSQLSQALLAQSLPPDFSALEKVVVQELKETNTPGAAVAIVSGDKLIYAKGFGVANVETGAPVTPEMLFRLGSTTKMFAVRLSWHWPRGERSTLIPRLGIMHKGSVPESQSSPLTG